MTMQNTANVIYARTLTRRTLFLQTAAAGLAATALATFAPRGTRAADPTSAELDVVLNDLVARGAPGISLSVERGGEPVYSGTAGVASIEQQTPLTAKHRFRLGSVAKPFTAIAVLQLVEDGILSLDDTAARWLDDPAVGRIPNVDRATLRQLLNHTSGIYDYRDDDGAFVQDAFLGPDADWTRVWTPKELLAYADGARHAPYFAPGAGWAYSNTGYVLLGLIVEQVTSRRLADELRDRILVPLALENTFFAEGAAIPDGAVDCYHALDGELVNVTAINLSSAWACGWTVSSMADFARFGRAVLGGELLSPASAEEMLAFVPDPRFETVGWGMGVWSQPSPHGQVVGIGGDGPGFTANLSRLSAGDLTVAVLINTAGGEIGSGEICDAAHTAVLGPA
jgi:D-alanyl-D-alanine carboxypeptidase